MYKHIRKLTQKRGAGALLVLIIVFVLIILMVINRYMNALTVTTRGIATQALVPGSYYSAYALLSDKLWHYRYGKNPPTPGTINSFTYGDASIGVSVQDQDGDLVITSSANLRSTTRALEALISGDPDYQPLHIVLALDSSGSGHEQSKRTQESRGATCRLDDGCPPCLYEFFDRNRWTQQIPDPSNPNLCEPLNGNRNDFKTKFLDNLETSSNPNLKITAIGYEDEAFKLSTINGGNTSFDTVISAHHLYGFDALFEQLSYFYPSGYTNIEDAILTAREILNASETDAVRPPYKLIIIGTDLGLMTQGNGITVYENPDANDYDVIPAKLQTIENQTTTAAQAAKNDNICIIAYSSIAAADITSGVEQRTYQHLLDNVLTKDPSLPDDHWCRRLDGLYLAENDPQEALSQIAQDINQLNLTIHEIDPLPTP